MQAGHARTTSKKSQISSRHKFSPTSTTMPRRVGGSDQKNLIAAARLRFSGSDVAMVPRQPRRSEFKTETRILREDLCRFIENESLRIAKQESFLRCGPMPESAESSSLKVLSIAFSSPQSTLEFLGRHQQINQAERQFLAYTIQAVSFVFGTNPAISKNLACLRRRAKQVAGILANAIGQSSPPPESTRLLISPFLTV